MIANEYYENKETKRIEKYCKQDVLTMIQVYLRLNNQNIIPVEYVEVVDY